MENANSKHWGASPAILPPATAPVLAFHFQNYEPDPEYFPINFRSIQSFHHHTHLPSHDQFPHDPIAYLSPPLMRYSDRACGT